MHEPTRAKPQRRGPGLPGRRHIGDELQEFRPIGHVEPLEEAPAHEIARIDAEDACGCRAGLSDRPRQVEADHDVVDDIREGAIGLVIGAVQPLARQGQPARDQGQHAAVAEPADDGGRPQGPQDQARCFGEPEMRAERKPRRRDDRDRQGRHDDRGGYGGRRFDWYHEQERESEARPSADRDADRKTDPGHDAQRFTDRQPTAARHADDGREGQDEPSENPSFPGRRRRFSHEAERRKRQGAEGQSEPGRDEGLVARELDGVSPGIGMHQLPDLVVEARQMIHTTLRTGRDQSRPGTLQPRSLALSEP